MKLADWKLYAFVLWPCRDQTIHEVISTENSTLPFIYCLKTEYGPIYRDATQIAFFKYTTDRLRCASGVANGLDGESEC